GLEPRRSTRASAWRRPGAAREAAWRGTRTLRGAPRLYGVARISFGPCAKKPRSTHGLPLAQVEGAPVRKDRDHERNTGMKGLGYGRGWGLLLSGPWLYGAAASAPGQAVEAKAEQPAPAQATFDVSDCQTCHEKAVDHITRTPHARVAGACAA